MSSYISPNFLAQTYNLLKRSPLKCIFWDFRVISQNLLNSSCHFSKHKSVTPQILDHFSVLWNKTSLNYFVSNRIGFQGKWHIKEQIFRLATALIKIHQIRYVIFGTKSQCSSNFTSLLRVMRHIFWHNFCTFSSKTLYDMHKANPSKCKFLNLWVAVNKIFLTVIEQFKKYIKPPYWVLQK